MTTEQFTREQFEKALPVRTDTGEQMWVYAGIIKGEHVYHIPVVNTNKRLIIRSSVARDGVARDTGKDSIRHHLQYFYKGTWQNGMKLGKKYTQRTAGWEARLHAALQELYGMAIAEAKSHHSYGTKFDVHGEQPEPEVERRQERGQPVQADASPPLPTPTEPCKPTQTVASVTPIAPVKYQERGDLTFPDYITAGLNPYQKAIVETLGFGPIVVEACPGSGKTYTNEHLVAAQIAAGIDPSKIGVFTFSSAAAEEARVRIASTLWPDASPSDLAYFSNPYAFAEERPLDAAAYTEAWLDEVPARRMITNWVCTIHALSLRLLKETGEKIRVLAGDRKASYEAKGIIDDALGEFDWKESQQNVQAFIGMAIRNLVKPSESEEFFSKVLSGTDIAWRAGQMAKMYQRYSDFMKRRKLVDFDMMQARVLWKIRNIPAWKAEIQAKFTHVVVDEAQDTSKYQTEIIWTLIEDTGNIVFTGDVDQALYAFRGAKPEVLREYFEAHWPNHTRLSLPINYRSTRNIIDAATQLITNSYCGPDDPYLKDFQPRPDAPEGDPIEYVETPTVGTLAREAANIVVENPGGWFILSRTRAECAAIHTELIKAGVPAVNKSGGLLFGAPHIRKALAYAMIAIDWEGARNNTELLTEVANVATVDFRAPFTKRAHVTNCPDRGKPSWKQSCTCPHIMTEGEDYVHARYWGSAGVAKCGSWRGIVKASSGYEKALETKATKDLTHFIYRLELLHEDAHQMVNTIISDCIGPWMDKEYGASGDESEDQSEDFDVLLGIAEGKTVEEFLAEVERLTNGGSVEDETQAVKVGTVHWSKGLESYGVIVNLTRCPIEPPKQKPGKLPMGRPATIEEERRLAFVAVTRAKERCVVMNSRTWNNKLLKRSQFIFELGGEGGSDYYDDVEYIDEA